MVRLHLGCGSNVRPGYDNIDPDSAAPGVIRADVTNLASRYPRGSVEQIVVHDVLEYLPQERVVPVLQHWADLLERGGSLLLRVPDLDKQIACYQSGLWNSETFVRMCGGPRGARDH